MTDTAPTADEPEDRWTADPRDGQDVLALWDFVYDFDDDWGGFATGSFLLRADGVLWIRTGSWHEWSRWPFLREPVDVVTAFHAVHLHHYTVYPPGPTPIDSSGSGRLSRNDGPAPVPLTVENAHLHTAPAPLP